MSKPIFIIRYPSDNLENSKRKHVLKQIRSIEHKYADYHILPVLDPFASEIKFECFNTPHTEIEFEELKRRVLEIIESPNV